MKTALAPGYDLFKLVVTLILAAILFILLLRGCASAPTPLSTGIATISPTSPPPTAELPTNPPSPTPGSLATKTLLPPTAESPTPASEATSTPTPLPLLASSTPTNEPVATPTPSPQAPPTATQATVTNPDCPGAALSRVKVGNKVRLLVNLNMRRDPGLGGAWILTNPNGTELEIIGGPACTRIDRRAYEWWRVRRADGREGWSAEASLTGRFYFLEPIP